MADQDFWIIDKTRPECVILILTDSTCLEAYFLEKETIERFFYFYFGKPATEGLFDEIARTLNDLFMLRASKNKNWPHASYFDDFEDFFSLENGKILINLDEYAKKIVAVSEYKINLDQLIEYKNHLCSSGHFFHLVNGHDFIKLINLIGKSMGVNRKILDEGAIFRSLVFGRKWNDINESHALKQIASWLMSEE